MKTFTFMNVQYRVEKSTDEYAANRGQPILDMLRHEDNAPCGRMTLCIPDVKLAAGETILKELFVDLISDLEEANVLMFTGRYAKSGYGQYPIVRLIP